MPRVALAAASAAVISLLLSAAGTEAGSAPLTLGQAVAQQPFAAASDDNGPPAGSSVYEGTWTLVELTYDGPGGVPEGADDVGDSVPGSIEITCVGARASGCQFVGGFWQASLTRDADGTFSSVEEGRLEDACGGPGPVHRTEIVGAFEGSKAVVTVSEVYVPRTYEYGQCTSWSTDEIWRFDGELANPVPSASGGGAADLQTFLSDYGLDCDGEPATGATCLMQQADAIYEVATRLDADGEVTGIDASVTSLDESMPSDAGGFLRGVAERAPVADTDALLAWFDQAITGGDASFGQETWTGTWSDSATDAGTVWALSLVRDVAPEPSASAPVPAAPTEAPTALPTPGGAAPSGAVGGNGQGDPRSFAASVPEPAEISTDPAIVVQSAVLAALLVFLMPFPSQLFNSTLENHEDEVRRWLRLDRLGAAARGMGAFWASWPGVVLFTGLAAVLYGFLDPTFGLDVGSLATFLGMLLGIVVVTVAFAVPTVLAHRRLGDRPSPSVVPVSLLIGVVCVLISRLTDFQPGYLYGLLIGLAFARELSAAEEGRATAVGAALMLGVAFVAWLSLGALPDVEDFGVVVARTMLAALMVAGLEGVVFGLLPMRFLPGEALYSWNRLLWGGLLLVGAFAFFHILINPASGYLSDTSRAPLFTVIGLLLGFTLVSVAFWAWFRFRSEPA